MCLHTKNIDKQIATEDITVWKVLRYIKFDSGDFAYLTPYRLAEVDLKKPMTSELIIEGGGGYFRFVNVGLHTFKNYKDTVHECKYWNIYNLCHRNEYFVVVKAIIPKNSEYAEGVAVENVPSYASNKLIFDESFTPKKCCNEN